MALDPAKQLIRTLKLRALKWSALIVAGVIAYGVGIYQGYQQYKTEQSLEFPPSAIAAGAISEPSKEAAPETSGKPKRTGSPRSPTGQH
jgi:uncharacterized membrane protein YebE (DUF533 family)